jgi:hypothetical protein
MGNYTTLVEGPMEYIVVLVTSYFRHLASAPKVHWQAGAGTPALEQEPKLLLSACSHNHTGVRVSRGVIPKSKWIGFELSVGWVGELRSHQHGFHVRRGQSRELHRVMQPGPEVREHQQVGLLPEPRLLIAHGAAQSGRYKSIAELSIPIT